MPHSAPRPRIAVFGAGSIGCHLGGHLAAGADVTLIGRPAAMDTLRAVGLTLTGGNRPAVRVEPAAVRFATTPDAAAGADFVLLTVKSAATRDAARELAPHLAPGAVVVSFQNGLRNAEVIRTELGVPAGARHGTGTAAGTETGAGGGPGAGPGRRVLAGMVPYNVLRMEPGRYHQGTGGVLMTDDDPAAVPLTRALGAAGVRIETRSDMREVQYAKLMLNLNNAINALSGLPLRDQLGLRDFRRCLALCQREALAVYRAEGVRPARLGPVPATWTPRLLHLPDGVFRRLAAAMLAFDAEARSSTWEDLRRGRPTEIDSLQGEIVALAGRHGLAAPANTRLVALIRQAEAAGADRARTWTGPQLLAELTAAGAVPGGRAR
ncbi:2-dehydropantoate 2-reductase [Streptomyces sp. NPDC018031]|uniref:2-dehydropantoate 2-reductase n=1 Tax=Streptomyces sp. NPDC018031 TaxID=3365033 RepID=UPI00378B67FF